MMDRLERLGNALAPESVGTGREEEDGSDEEDGILWTPKERLG